MEAARKIFKDAIQNIDIEFYRRNERAFTYECYKNVVNIQHRYNFDFSAEITKATIVPSILKRNRFFSDNFYYSTRKEGTFNRTPDFVFHNNYNTDHQLFAIEVKPIRISPSLSKKDLAKLMFYCNSELNFNKGILVLFGLQNQNLRGAIIPEFNEILREFPEIEIWIARPNSFPIIYCSTNLIPLL